MYISNKNFNKIIPLALAVIFLTQSPVKGQRGRRDLSPLEYGKKVVEKLCQPTMEGRGYVRKGVNKAANYIESKYEEFDLEKFRFAGRSSYSQEFRFKVNSFPGDLELRFDGMGLEPGVDYLVAPNSGGTETRRYLSAMTLNPSHIKSEEAYEELEDKDLENTCVLINVDTFKKYKDNKYYEEIRDNEIEAAALIYLEDKNKDLTWGVSTNAKEFPIIHAKRSEVPDSPQMVTLSVDQEYRTAYKTRNLIGYIEGDKYPDSFLIFTAHYDHLGRMGVETYFPGANDNASGVSMLLNLARYFSNGRNTPDYSVVFMAFTAEEAGLIGSSFFANKPWFSLSNIKFLINLDLFGNGKKGMMVVNGKIFDKQFERLTRLNAQGNYLPKIKKRGEAANSDHYPFYEKGVPSFFCYLMEDYPYYHDIHDKPKNLSYENYEPAFNLLVDFVESYNEKRRR